MAQETRLERRSHYRPADDSNWFTCQHHRRRCYLVCLQCLMQAKHNLSEVPMRNMKIERELKFLVTIEKNMTDSIEK